MIVGTPMHGIPCMLLKVRALLRGQVIAVVGRHDGWMIISVCMHGCIASLVGTSFPINDLLSII